MGDPALGRVGYFPSAVNKLNKFQLILESRPDTGLDNFDIIFGHDQIQWETGNASGGTNGLGGSSARAGWSNGTNTFYELPGSGVNGAFLDGGPNSLVDGSNVGMPMMWVYEARNGTVSSGVPEPAAIVVWSGLLLVGGVIARRAAKRRQSTVE